jgi:flagellar hook assembly protein FlgD
MTVELVVYNMLGQKLKVLHTGRQKAGYHNVRWDGTNEFGSSMGSGIYIYRLKTEENSLMRKMILIR